MSSPAPTSLWTRTLVYLGLWEEGDSYEQPAPVQVEAEREPTFADHPVGNVRPLRLASTATVARTEVIEVATFDDCEVIARTYRDGRPVLFDLAAVDRTTARRVIDFVSGATYVLRGSLQRVGSRAFLLVPEGVDVPAEERDRIEARGYRFADPA